MNGRLDVNMTHNSFKQSILNKKKQIGIWCNIESPLVAEILADAGFDWIVIDSEYGQNSVAELLTRHHAIAQYATESLIKLPNNDKVEIEKLVDVGVRNFLIPFVDSEHEAKEIVSFTRFPPRGIRRPSALHRNFGRRKHHCVNAYRDLCIVLLVDTLGAIVNLPRIISVDGIDAIFIEPTNLAASMGYIGNRDHPKVQEAIIEARQHVISAEKPIGIFEPVEENARKHFSDGFSFIAVSNDIGLISDRSNVMRDRFRDIV